MPCSLTYTLDGLGTVQIGRHCAAATLGLLAAGLLYMVLAWGLNAVAVRSDRAPEAFLGWAFLVMLPAAVFAGGLVSGRVCAAGRRRLLSGLLVSPGLYVAVLLMVVSCKVGSELYIGLVVLHWLGAALVLALSLGGYALGSRSVRQPGKQGH